MSEVVHDVVQTVDQGNTVGLNVPAFLYKYLLHPGIASVSSRVDILDDCNLLEMIFLFSFPRIKLPEQQGRK
jgi:hypothetical protein